MGWNIHVRVTCSIEITLLSSTFTFQLGNCMTSRLNTVCSCLVILLTINLRSMTLLAASSQQLRTNQLIYWVLGRWYSTFCNLRPSGYFGKRKPQRHGSMNSLLLFHKVFLRLSAALAQNMYGQLVLSVTEAPRSNRLDFPQWIFSCPSNGCNLNFSKSVGFLQSMGFFSPYYGVGSISGLTERQLFVYLKKSSNLISSLVGFLRTI